MGRSKLFVAFRGAVACEAQFWRIYIMIPYWRFLRRGVWPRVGYDDEGAYRCCEQTYTATSGGLNGDQHAETDRQDR